MLLQNGADPNLPLGRGTCNVLCALTTHAAHKSRSCDSSMRCLLLFHKLMLAGADIFASVKLGRGRVGTVLDFAHMAFTKVL